MFTLIFNIKDHPFSIQNHYITIPNIAPISLASCTVVIRIDDKQTIVQGFFPHFYEWIAYCCVTTFQHAQLLLVNQTTTFELFTLEPARGHQLLMYSYNQLCYKIGRSSSVVRNAAGQYDARFSSQLERYVQQQKQLQLSPTKQHDMKAILTDDDYALLLPYVEEIVVDYMPKEKAQHFIAQLAIGCRILNDVLRNYRVIPKLHLHLGKKGTNGYYDQTSQTIGLYYKYDRDTAMQLALFHEYGHFYDKQQQQIPFYKKKRQSIYEQLQHDTTLRAITQDRTITDDYRQYLLSIDEVMARLFESTIYYHYYGTCSDKPFLFTAAEIKKASIIC